MAGTVRVQIWSDVQCVWCYIGEARWRAAVAEFGGPVEITFRSFELQPDSPVDFDAQEYLSSARGLDAAAQESLFDAMRGVAEAAGVPYAPELIRPTNSHLALQLLHYANSLDRHEQTLDRLFTAYFAEGRHLGTIDALVELAAEAGLDPERTRVVLDEGRFAAEVEADTTAARALGVRGVPFAVVNDTYAVPGALETAQLVDLLRRAAA